jgi:CDP-diacylglycerol pyrophosphatase
MHHRSTTTKISGIGSSQLLATTSDNFEEAAWSDNDLVTDALPYAAIEVEVEVAAGPSSVEYPEELMAGLSAYSGEREHLFRTNVNT